MIAPVTVATWIAFCVPWAEPLLLAGLIEAGSGGEPFLLSDDGQTRVQSSNLGDALTALRRWDAKDKPRQIYIGLAQIPERALPALGIPAEAVLDNCTNLEIAYTLFLKAFDEAGRAEKSPWKRLSTAYNYFRTGKLVFDTPFAKQATDYVMTGKFPPPARIGTATYHAVAAEWSAGLAWRHSLRHIGANDTILISSSNLVQMVRSNY